MTSLYKTETRHHPQGKICHHYACHGLTCDEYDAMRARANGHCEICGIAEEETPLGLVIDHFQGRWTRFIRGLICSRCNSNVMQCIDGNRKWGKNRHLEERAREYERNSWQQPSREALREMATRTEMLDPFGPRPEPVLYQLPRTASFSPEEIRAAAEMALRRRTEKVAAKLRRQLSPDEIKCLIECLQEEDRPTAAVSLTS